MIVILFLFVIMLPRVDRAEEAAQGADRRPAAAAAVIGAALCGLVIVVTTVATDELGCRAAGDRAPTALHRCRVDRPGALFSDYATSFEITAAAALAIAVIGAVVLTRAVRKAATSSPISLRPPWSCPPLCLGATTATWATATRPDAADAAVDSAADGGEEA
ncbi:MAG: NADH-quinone oxidoreductase subunit J [Acidimicrobiales bacterium]